MKFKRILFAAVSVLILGACGTSKQITYFQDLQPGVSEMKVQFPSEIRVQPKDQLSIVVTCQDSKLTAMFNLPRANVTIGQEGGGSSSSGGVMGYIVDSKGKIDFPVLGKLKIVGMTREEVSDFIKEQLESKNLLKDPVVMVDFMNLVFSVLGEVNSPGRYSIDKDELTILDALSQAGDLTINGRRDNVMVLRNDNGTQRVYSVNLTSAEDVYKSPVYHLQQNDVVYVEPNGMKARQSTVNGNTIRSTGFWMSFVSFVSSMVVLITSLVK